MPVLFLRNGIPMNSIEVNQFVSGVPDLAKILPQPNAFNAYRHKGGLIIKSDGLKIYNLHYLFKKLI